MKHQPIHWSGGVKHAMGTRLQGWPCCCSGDRCIKISEQPSIMTTDVNKVSCKTCIRIMRKDPILALNFPLPKEPELNEREINAGKSLLEEINLLASARTCYPSDEDHDHAMISHTARALRKYRNY